MNCFNAAHNISSQWLHYKVTDFHLLNGDRRCITFWGQRKGLSTSVTMKPLRKNHLSLPHPQQRKGRCGRTTEPVLYKSCLCPSSALFLLLSLMRKCAFPARVKEHEDSTADAAQREQRCGSSRKTANDKEKYSGSDSTFPSDSAQPPTPPSLPSLTQGLAQIALENFAKD